MNSMKKFRLAALIASLTIAGAARADTIVATIDGCYDCRVSDSPSLIFHNTSGGTLTNAQMVLHAYQGLNNGISQTVTLPDLAAGDRFYDWLGAFVPGNLTSFDYDDEYGGTAQTVSNPDCVLGSFYCAFVGNFDVTFTAKISGGAFDGNAVFSVFSPSSNDTGGFLGWQGLDPTGLSETVYDQHSGSTSTVNGTLAHISLGVPPTNVPEPTSIIFLMTVVAFLAIATRRQRASS